MMDGENERRSTWLPLSPLSGAAGCYHGCNESSFISISAPSHHSQQDCSSSEMRIRACCLADAHACVCRRMDVWNVLSHALTCWCCDRPWSDWCLTQETKESNLASWLLLHLEWRGRFPTDCMSADLKPGRMCINETVQCLCRCVFVRAHLSFVVWCQYLSACGWGMCFRWLAGYDISLVIIRV